MSHNLVEMFFQFIQKTILNITKNKTKVFLPPKAEFRVSIAPPGPYSESDSRFLFGRSHRARCSPSLHKRVLPSPKAKTLQPLPSVNVSRKRSERPATNWLNALTEKPSDRQPGTPMTCPPILTNVRLRGDSLRATQAVAVQVAIVSCCHCVVLPRRSRAASVLA